MHIKFIQKLTWQEVYKFWAECEENRDNWVRYYQKRGFPSWKEWRDTYIKPFGCEKLEWGLYEITDPMVTVPEFCGGPFRTWIEKFYDGKQTLRFLQLADLKDIQTHQGIQEIKQNFPWDKKIIGMLVGNEIFVIEGTHRCCAIALMQRENFKTKNKLYIALAKFLGEKLPVVGRELYKRN